MKANEMSMLYATQDGKQIDERVVDRLMDKIEKIFDNLEYRIEKELEAEDSGESIGNLANQGFNKLLHKLAQHQEPFDVELVQAVYRSRVNLELNENGCDNLHRLSAVGWNEYHVLGGDQYANPKFGYRPIIDHLASKIPSELIRLNEIVENIDWSMADKLALTTYNQVTQTRNTYVADYALTTVSLGYLKRNHFNMFTPQLPVNKIKAIDSLGYGVMNKVFVVFDRPLFDRSIEGMQILWRRDVNFSLDYSDRKWQLQVFKYRANYSAGTEHSFSPEFRRNSVYFPAEFGVRTRKIFGHNPFSA
jgi:spermine oxidase